MQGGQQIVDVRFLDRHVGRSLDELLAGDVAPRGTKTSVARRLGRAAPDQGEP